MGWWGGWGDHADPGTLDSAAGRLDEYAWQLAQAYERFSSLALSIDWQGDAADRFHDETTEAARRVADARSRIGEAADRLRRAANDLREEERRAWERAHQNS